MWRILGGRGMLTKLTPNEKRSRYFGFITEHAPILIGFHGFILGVLLTNQLYQFGLVGVPEWPNALITLSALFFSGSQLIVAVRAAKPRGDQVD
jgi:hypothetical protein